MTKKAAHVANSLKYAVAMALAVKETPAQMATSLAWVVAKELHPKNPGEFMVAAGLR